jgi:hypothetical protein
VVKNAHVDGAQRSDVDDAAGGPGEGDRMHSAELDRDAAPGQPGAAFGDPDEEQRQPAQQHVGADAGLEAVEHRPQFEGGLQVPEAAFGFEEVLVAQRDVFGGQVGVAGGQLVLAVEAFLGGDLLPVDDQTARGQLPQPPAQGGVVAQRALGPQVHGLVGTLGAWRI